MKLLFLCESLWDHGPVYDIHIISESLNILGCEVTILDPGYMDTDGFNLTFAGISLPLSNISVCRPNLRRCKRNIIGYLRAHLIRSILFTSIIRNEKPDVVVTYSVSRYGVINLTIPMMFRVPVVYRCIDVMHQLWLDKLRSKITLFLEKLLFKFSKRVFVLSQSYYNYASLLGADPNKLEIHRFPIVKLDNNTNTINTKKIVGFIGIFYKFSGLVELIVSINKFKNMFDGIEFHIYGDGDIFNQLSDYIACNNIQNIVILKGFVSSSEVGSVVNSFDLCLNTMHPIGIKNYIFNAKLIQYMAYGKYVFSISRDLIDDELPTIKTGIYYFPTFDQLVLAIPNFLINNNGINCNGLSYVDSFHTYQDISNNMLNSLKKLKDSLK